MPANMLTWGVRRLGRTRASVFTSPSWQTFPKTSSSGFSLPSWNVCRHTSALQLAKRKTPTSRSPALGRGDGGRHPDPRRASLDIGRLDLGHRWSRRRRRHGRHPRGHATRGATSMCRGVPTTRRGQCLGTVYDILVGERPTSLFMVASDILLSCFGPCFLYM